MSRARAVVLDHVFVREQCGDSFRRSSRRWWRGERDDRWQRASWWEPDQRMPLVVRELTGHKGGAAAIAVFQDLREVVAGTGIERASPQSSSHVELNVTGLMWSAQ